MRLPPLAGPAAALASFALALAALRGLRAAPARAAAAAAATPSAARACAELPPGFALRGAAPSLEALAARVVEALGRGDRGALLGLALTRSEHRELVFPRLAVDAHAGADFFFDTMAAGSLRDLEHALGDLGGMSIELVAARADATQAERYGELTIHRGVVLRLRVRGEERESRLLNGVVEHRGAFKVTRYKRD